MHKIQPRLRPRHNCSTCFQLLANLHCLWPALMKTSPMQRWMVQGPVYSLQTDNEGKGSQPFIYLDFKQQRYKCGTRKQFLGFSNCLSFHMHVPVVICHLSFWTVVGTSPITTSYWAPHSHQCYTGILADFYLAVLQASLMYCRALETISESRAAAGLTVAVRLSGCPLKTFNKEVPSCSIRECWNNGNLLPITLISYTKPILDLQDQKPHLQRLHFL